MSAVTLDKQQAQSRSSDLFHMTWPMLIGVLSLMSFQLADSFFIARLGTDPLAVVGFTIPIYQLIIGFQVGIGIATTALISQLLGANKADQANVLAGHILLFGSGVISLLCFLIWVFRESILFMLGGDESLVGLIDSFWGIWLFSAFTGAFLYFGYSICRAHGNTKTPGMVMVLTSLLNIALDPLYIFYFDLGLVGAAYATLTSFGLGLFIIYPKIFAKQWLCMNHWYRKFFESVRGITAVAAPAMLSQLLPAIASMLATAMVAQYGIAAVAAWGLGLRVEFFTLVLILALTMSLPPMIGKQFGAKNHLEISELLKLAIKFTLLVQTGFALLIFLCSAPLSTLLAPEIEVASHLELYLIAIPISYGPLGVCMILVSASNAVSQAMRALSISFARLFICFLPFLWLGAYIADYEGLVVGAMIGNILAGLFAWFSYQRGKAKWERSQTGTEASS